MPYSSRAISMSISSPSSRRAWVEIGYRTVSYNKTVSVALLAEGVGRNIR